MPLPDPNTDDYTVVGMLLDRIQKLVQDHGVDGMRINTVAHSQGLWSESQQVAGFFTLREVLIDYHTGCIANDTCK